MVGAEEAAATKLEEDENVGGMTERITTVVAITSRTPRSTAGGTAPFATLTNRRDKNQHANTTHDSPAKESTSQAWCTSTEDADLENFQVVVGDGAESRSIEMPGNISFPANMEVQTNTLPGDTAVLIDTAASGHIYGDRRIPYLPAWGGINHQVPAVCASKRHGGFRVQRSNGRS